MNLRQYQHIIWDWNGTLMDDTWLCVEIINTLLARRKMTPVSRHDYRRDFDFPVERYYRRLGFSVDGEGFREISVEFISEYERRRFECLLHPGVAQALGLICGAGITQSILSSYRQLTLDEIVPHYGLGDYFVRLVGSPDIYAAGKIEAGRRWASQLALSPDDLLLVGDTVHDYEVAEAIGADCVLLSHGHHPPDRLLPCGVPVLDSLQPMLEALPSANKGTG